VIRALAMSLAVGAAGFGEETLRYSINWPSGLSLGEATLESRAVSSGKDAPSRREFRFTLDASVPGFAVADRLRSLATDRFCSIEFEKKLKHGSRVSAEKTTFDPEARLATRVTNDGGGKTEIPVAACANDALSYLYFLRDELAQGRLPATRTILFGAPYEIGVQLAGQETLLVGDQRVPTDRLQARLKGPASETKFELFFARDETRRLVRVRVPLPLGSFSMDLVD